mmetsp:Transcript_23962/g.43753  ORF Transcript_23962/g.43753 Transcript_23962/m.43753 type:complete len:116 (-) Transcript_23962:3-350(-)
MKIVTQGKAVTQKTFAQRTFFGAFTKELCKRTTQLMLSAAFGGALLGAATAGVLEETPVVPSGNDLHLQEILYEVRADESRVARFRYIMPLIRQGVEFMDIEDDFFHLCIGVEKK